MKRITIRAMVLPVLLLALIPVGRSSVGASVISGIPSVDAGWEIYADQEWGYSIEYPRDWTTEVVFTNDVESPPYVIRKEVRFSGPDGVLINVDVWQKDPDLNLMTWLDENQRRMLELGQVIIPGTTNAVTSEQASVVLTQTGTCTSFPLVYTYVPATDRVFDIFYYAADGGESLDVYRQMLSSFSSNVERDTGVSRESISIARVPELSFFEAALVQPLGWEECYWGWETPTSATCCGYTSSVTAHKCSLERETYRQRGNCVWWAARQRPDVGSVVLVGAGQWAEAARNAGFPVDGTPQVGDVFCNNVQHVAYVTAVYATTVDVTEMGWCRSLPCRVKSVNYSIGGISFIHRKNNSPDTAITAGPSGTIGVRNATFVWTGTDDQTPPASLQYSYKLDGYSDWSGWTSSTSATYNDLSDRSYTFWVKAKDQTGYEDASPDRRDFTVDASPPNAPTISISGPGCSGIQNNGWQNTCNDPAFTWSATDVGGSGIQGYNRCWSTSSNCAPPATWIWTTGTSFDPPAIASPGGVASYTLNVRARDNQNHDSSIATFGVLYDGAPPTVTLQINNGAATTNQTNILLNLSAGDVGSGVSDVRISNNNLDWSPRQSYADTIAWTLPALDRQSLTVYVQVRDRAGNESVVTSDAITLDLYPLAPHSANYRICQDVVDAGGSMGLASTGYRLTSAIGQPWATGATANTSAGFAGRAGFLADVTGCLPISYSVTSNFTVTQWVVASGGNLHGSASYRLSDTAGQPAASGATAFTSANYSLSSGFWAQITGTVPPTTTLPPVPPTLTPTVPPPPPPSPTPQPAGFGVSIQDGAPYTNDPLVTVRVWAPNVTHVRLSNDSGYSDDDWRTYQVTTTWVLSTHESYVTPRTVYAWFHDAQNSVYGPYSDDIIYDPIPPEGLVSILGGETSTVTLWLEAWDNNSGVGQMRVAGSPGAISGASFRPYTNTLEWVLTGNVVYAQFQDRAANLSSIYGSDGSAWETVRRVHLPLVVRNR